jgi:hypothetical protein
VINGSIQKCEAGGIYIETDDDIVGESIGPIEDFQQEKDNYLQTEMQDAMQTEETQNKPNVGFTEEERIISQLRKIYIENNRFVQV